jgi:hypothetical protein
MKNKECLLLIIIIIQSANILCAWLLIPSGMTPQDNIGVKWSVLKVSTAKTGRQSLYDTVVYYLKWSVLKVSTALAPLGISTLSNPNPSPRNTSPTEHGQTGPVAKPGPLVSYIFKFFFYTFPLLPLRSLNNTKKHFT